MHTRDCSITSIHTVVYSHPYDIRDGIIIGIKNQALSEQLQYNPKLTLEKAKTLVQQREAICDQQQFLKPSSGTTVPIGAVKSTQKYTSR